MVRRSPARVATAHQTGPRSKEPSPQNIRLLTVSSNKVPTISGAASSSSTPKISSGVRAVRSSSRVVPARNTCQASTSSPTAECSAAVMISRPHRHGRDDGERHGLDGDPGAVLDGLIGELPQGRDEHLGMRRCHGPNSPTRS